MASSSETVSGSCLKMSSTEVIEMQGFLTAKSGGASVYVPQNFDSWYTPYLKKMAFTILMTLKQVNRKRDLAMEYLSRLLKGLPILDKLKKLSQSCLTLTCLTGESGR